MVLKRQELDFSQFAQDPVDMDCAETKRISQNVLVQGAIELIFTRETDHSKTIAQLEEEVGRSLDCSAPPNACEVLNGYGFIARRRPKDGGTQVRKLIKDFKHARDFDPADLGVRDSRERVIGCTQ